MAKGKQVREKGKIKLSRYFQKLKEGDRVSVVRELAERASFPPRLQGRAGVIDGIRGNSYIVRLKDFNKEKRFIIHPIHLKKLK